MSLENWEQNLNTYWIKYAGKIGSRDKMYRFIQYFAKMTHFQLKQSGAPAETVKWLNHVSKTFSTGRKFIRIGKFIDNWYKAYKHLCKHAMSLSSEKDLVNVLTLMSYVADMIFYLWDALVWAEAAKIWAFPGMKCKLRRTQWNMYRYSIKALKDFLKLRTLKAGTVEYYSTRRIMCKSMIDVCNPLQGLGYNDLNAGQIGAMGVLTSCISIYDDFNK
eukprot:CAMPEP_0184486166 /NCGR_PEP_ID=MMETSP0113_2-20130426/7703_1 /TAXON_ID=91329 /ORGANISM="Norrisiella sphaerica, Strain BC52" /LENGTH=217 /DNA_ID=CAMNT_0026867915 /DNA_START=77 /DNA_END=730 /DNA_ORIENTATION=-